MALICWLVGTSTLLLKVCTLQPRVLLIWIIVGQGPTVLAVGAGGGGLDIFSFLYHFSSFLPLSWRQPDID